MFVEPNVYGILLLIAALTSTFGLSYAIAGSINAGKLQRLRNEENTIRYLVMLTASMFDVMAVWPFIQIESPLNTLIVVTIAGIGAVASWKMFSSGSSRGEILFGYDLRDILDRASNTLNSLVETGIEIKNDHNQNLIQIHESIAQITNKLELDQKIKDFARDSAKTEAENTVNKHIEEIQDYGLELLYKMNETYCVLSDKLSEMFLELKDNLGTSPNLDEQHSEPKQDDNVVSEYVKDQIIAGSSVIGQSQKILRMISLDLSQYSQKGINCVL